MAPVSSGRAGLAARPAEAKAAGACATNPASMRIAAAAPTACNRSNDQVLTLADVLFRQPDTVDARRDWCLFSP